MLNILQNLYEQGEFACIYLNEDAPGAFAFGRVLAVDEAQTVLYMVSPSGRYDGLLAVPTDRIYRVEWGNAYAQDLMQPAVCTNLPQPPLQFGPDDYFETVLRYARKAGKVVSIELLDSGVDDAAGSVLFVTEEICVLRLLTSDGVPDGQCAIRLSDITRICCDSADERRLQAPSERGDVLAKDEIRAIKLSRKAIEEMLWETFMECGDRLLGLDNHDDGHVFHMSVDDDLSTLVFYACNLKDQLPYKDANVSNYVNQMVETSTDSIYEANDSAPRYRKLSF